jgi:hypothetical protein
MRHLQGFIGINHPQLFTFITYEPDFLAPDTVIDIKLFKYVFPSLL